MSSSIEVTHVAAAPGADTPRRRLAWRTLLANGLHGAVFALAICEVLVWVSVIF